MADSTGTTALYSAVDMHTMGPMLSRPSPKLLDKLDSADIAKMLIAKGANVNAANDAGMTPLHYAAQRGSDRIIEFLASQGARFDAKNKQGRSPSELARGKTAALMNKLAAGNATTQQ